MCSPLGAGCRVNLFFAPWFGPRRSAVETVDSVGGGLEAAGARPIEADSHSTGMPVIALFGSPNTGKTSLFNQLTGARHAVANYPGVTVEVRTGQARANGRAAQIVDLPGVYSLTAYSPDELVAREFLVDRRPDAVIVVLDASNLERNFYVLAQVLEMNVPVVIALNMIDAARRGGLSIDEAEMSRRLGVPVIATVGTRGEGVPELLAAALDAAESHRRPHPALVAYGHPIDECIHDLAESIERDPALEAAGHPRWLAIKLLEGDAAVQDAVRRRTGPAAPVSAAVQRMRRHIEVHCNDTPEAIVAERRYGFAAGLARLCICRATPTRRDVTDNIDGVVCHRVGGPLILAAVVYALFVAVFKVADEWEWLLGRSLTGWVEWVFARAGELVAPLAERAPLLHSLLRDGVIGGVGGVLSFVPLIAVMFLFVAIIEDTGYVARVAFILDRALKSFGLQGKSILAMVVSGGLGGGGCAVPGVMATRTLRDHRDRVITMLVAPMMNCGAKIPVYLMLIAAFFSRHQARMMFILWALSWTLALLSALLIRRFVVRGEPTPFVMELPPYRMPTLRGALLHTWERTGMYLKKAGTVILAVSIVLWALMYFPRLDDPSFAQRLGDVRASLGGDELAVAEAAILGEQSAAQLRHSIAGRLGTGLERLSRFAGFDWRDNIALMGGFAAKEVVVGTLGVAYSMGEVDPDAPDSLAAKLASDPGWSPLRAFALMVFVMIYAPCMTTMVMISRESGAWKWALFATAYATTLAFVLAIGVYQIGGVLGWGV